MIASPPRPAADDVPRFLTVAEVCDRLRIRKSKAYGLLNSGQLRSVKIGGSRRVAVEALREFAATLTGGDAQ